MNAPCAAPDRHRSLCALAALIVALATLAPHAAHAQESPLIPIEDIVGATPVGDARDVGDQTTATTVEGNEVTINVGLPGEAGKPSQSIVIILLLTLLSLAPALLVMLTSFTRIVIVLSLARNALGLQNIPPNIVITGLALFLSLFVMGPTLEQINEQALQPYLAGDLSTEEALQAAEAPMKDFMMGQTRPGELKAMLAASGEGRPPTPDDVSMTSLVPAFILSELKTAFLIGFMIFIPFLVIDLVVSSSLMSMGMFMLPPSMVSLPFKLLLFVLVDGWGLITTTLLQSF